MAMPLLQLKELLDNGAHLAPLTVAQYHRMIESGILPEGAPIELLDGILVRNKPPASRARKLCRFT